MAKKSAEITIREAREQYGYTRQQLYNLVDSKAVKSRKIGWQHFINRRSLEHYITSHGRSTRGQTKAAAEQQAGQSAA
jgi:hypothetical protein